MPEQDYGADSRLNKGSPDKNATPLESGGSFRAKGKSFMKEKGPEIAKVAVTIGVLVFNVVSFCC
jgi:hypothetical protein